MDKPVYPITEIEPLLYRFDSIGIKGVIQKIVVYQPLERENEFNLALLDYVGGRFSDSSISDNGDMEKVLATVVLTFDYFFALQPQASIVFSGSDAARTRLYKIAIGKYEPIATKKFYIYGGREGVYEPFEPNENYDSFIIQQNDGDKQT